VAIVIPILSNTFSVMCNNEHAVMAYYSIGMLPAGHWPSMLAIVAWLQWLRRIKPAA